MRPPALSTEASLQTALTDYAHYAAQHHTQVAEGSALESTTATAEVQAYDAAIAERLRLGEQQLQQGLRERGLSLRYNTELNLAHDLRRLTRFIVRFFQLGRYLNATDFESEVTFCETPEEFAEAILQSVHLSEWLRAGEATKIATEIRALAQATNGGGARGVSVPNGVYINGWLFNHGKDTAVRALLKTPAEFPRLLGTAVHELAHVFFQQFSELGAEKASIGGQALEYAQQFHLRLIDSPRVALLKRKWRTIHRASIFLEEGWATWLGNCLAPVVLGQPRLIRYTLAQLWDAIHALPYPAEDRALLQSALRDLFLVPPDEPDQLMWAVSVMEQLHAEAALQLSQPLEYVLGVLLFERLEAQVGLSNVPLAVLVSANVKYDVETIGWIDLSYLLRFDPRFNPNWRLAALTSLNWPAPPTWPAVAEAAAEQLNLAVPPKLLA